MNIVLFITLLTGFSVISSLVVQAIKKLFGKLYDKIPSNLVAFTIACVVGVGGTAIYYALTGISFNAQNIILMCLMGVATSVSSMVGYDKVTQAIKQITGGSVNTEDK